MPASKSNPAHLQVICFMPDFGNDKKYKATAKLLSKAPELYDAFYELLVESCHWCKEGRGEDLFKDGCKSTANCWIKKHWELLEEIKNG